jgi:hypothetical protein
MEIGPIHEVIIATVPKTRKKKIRSTPGANQSRQRPAETVMTRMRTTSRVVVGLAVVRALTVDVIRK